MGAGLHVLAQNERQYFSSPGAAIAAVAHPKQAHWLPMFPQQGLKPRDRSRGDAVTRAVFVPRVGRLLYFDHDLLHEGRLVTRGVKYAIRTELMFEPDT